MATIAPEPGINRLLEQIELTRTGLRRYQRMLGGIATSLVVLGLVAIIAGADFGWELSPRARAVGLLVVLGITSALVTRLVLQPGRRFGRADAASEVEAGFPALGQRVRTTLEYAEPTSATAPAAPGLIDALKADTGLRTRDLDLPAVIPWRTLRAPAGALALLVAAGGCVVVREPELGIALRRVFLIPAQYTRLEVKPGNEKLKVGADFALEATVSGRAVPHAEWRRRAASSGSWTTVPLGPRGEEAEGAPKALVGTLNDTLKDCQDSFDYQVVAGSVESPVYHVTVLRPLAIQRVEAVVEPPAYTKRPPTTEKTGDFKVIEGSTVRLRLTLDRTPRAAQIVMTYPAENARASQVLSAPTHINGNVIEASLPALDRTVEYAPTATAADGMALDPHTYKIRVQPDEKPVIRFVRPAEELAVIPTTDVPIEAEAADDFGVTKVGITYQIDGGPKETLLLDEPKGQPLKVKELVTLYLEKHPLEFTSSLAYASFAEDNYPGTPHRASTELRYIDILPFKQAYQLSEGQCNCEGKSTTLEALIHRQRANLNRTHVQAEEAAPSAEAAPRIAKAEKELLALTTEFTEGLEARFGPVTVLHLATTAMEAAVSDLDRAQWKPAVTDQELALTSLIKARQNLRKLLKNSASASACQSYDRQQQQKFRKPPPKKADPQIAEQLKELGQQERTVSQGLCPNPGKGQGAAPKSAESAEKLAERQDTAARRAEELRKAVRADEALTPLAQDRMDKAAGKVTESRDSLRAGQTEQAAERASDAADQLERLAEQVAGLKAKELAARLAQARNVAKTLAGEQAKTGSASASRQTALAEQAGTLADWLKRLPADAADESRELSQALRQAVRDNPPDEIHEAMQAAADALKAGQAESAARESQNAARRLAALAQDLDEARRAFMQPQLDGLFATEKLAAKTQGLLKSAHNDGEKAEAEKAVSDLVEKLRKLQAREGEGQDALTKATEKLAESQTRRGGGWGGFQRPSREGPNENRPVLVPPGEYTDGVSRVIAALQAKIQEVVLKEVLLDKDEAVPPQYRALVEDYYKTLSEDLR